MCTSTVYRLLLILCSLSLPLSRTSGVSCIALLFSPSTSIPNISIIVIIAVSCPRIFSPNKNILINCKRNINSAGRSIFYDPNVQIFQGIVRKKNNKKLFTIIYCKYLYIIGQRIRRFWLSIRKLEGNGTNGSQKLCKKISSEKKKKELYSIMTHRRLLTTRTSSWLRWTNWTNFNF